jgi:hypothetical protein
MPEIQWQIDLAAAFIAIVALGISIYFGWRPSNIELESLRQQRDNDIIAWSDAAIDACCRAEMVLDPDYAVATSEQEFQVNRLETLAGLSSAIDKGRLYFPNRQDDAYGLEKDAAYRGHRHAALDRLVGVYALLSGVSHASPDRPARSETRERAICYKREFVSIVQSEVDPKRRVHFLDKDGRKGSEDLG